MAVFSLKADKKNNNRVMKQIIRTPKQTNRGIRSALQKVGVDYKKEAKRLITQPPKTGFFYNIVVNGREILHRASDFQESPANLTGSLRDTVSFRLSGNELEFGAGTGRVDYARSLELGIDILPRPYLIKAINNKSKNAMVVLKERIKKRVKKL